MFDYVCLCAKLVQAHERYLIALPHWRCTRPTCGRVLCTMRPLLCLCIFGRTNDLQSYRERWVSNS